MLWHSTFRDYEIAIEFLNVNPDFSLLKFREILSVVCGLIAENGNVRFESDQLFEQISTLYDRKCISPSLKDNLHETRQLCNSGVHKPVRAQNEDEVEFQSKLQKDLVDTARKARRLTLEIFEKSYLIITDEETFPDYTLVDEGIQEHRAMLFDGITSQDAWKKYKAGLLCESIADNALGGMSLIVSSDFSYHQESIYKVAADLYEASYKISADVHQQMRMQVQLTDVEDIFLKHADVEAMFRYARLILGGYFGEEYIDKGMSLLRAAADRGHMEACAEYGAHLYDQSATYEESLHYLEKAASQDVPFAFVALWHFYTDGKACDPDHNSALKWLGGGVKLDYPDALACLGISYNEGICHQKDANKAEMILKGAMEKGSQKAYRYYVITFNDLAGKMASRFKEVGEALKAIDKERKPKPVKRARAKVGPNNLCPCGSNKKYKKCCRDKPHKEISSVFPPFSMN